MENGKVNGLPGHVHIPFQKEKPKSDAQIQAENLAARVRAAKTQQEREDILSKAQDAAVRRTNKQRENEFRATHYLLLAFFVLLLALKIIGIYLFKEGFLLTRLVLEHKSECALPPADISASYKAGSFQQGCWHPKTFDKAVVIIIDALRYDFTIPFQANDDHPTPRAFHDGVPVFYDTAVKTPENAVLLPFIADPPTTTLQRLKGLTTGTLPTFIDAGSNFAGTAIDEDNLIMQAVKANKTVVQLGDDTWQSLFPGYFDEELTHPFDSFNVWDLHTVDNGVTRHLMPLLQPSNTSKWDLLIGHYLGVDHAGHRYGPDHPAMKSKLAQMNTVISEAMALIDDKTLLVVMGDHGMDSKGDHGGESDDEVEAALWMYSKAKVFGRSSLETRTPPPTAKVRPVNQIDLVPTLAYLLGLPVPFNNLGTPIEEAFLGPKGTDYATLAAVNRLTAAQIRNYQREYAQIRKPDASAMAPPDRKWEAATSSWASLRTAKTTTAQFKQLAQAFYEYQASNLQVCKDLWARFDVLSMAMGVAILLYTFILSITFARSLKGDITIVTTALFIRGLAGFGFGAILGTLIGFWIPFLGLVRMLCFLAAMGCCIALSWQLFLFRERLSRVLPRSIWSWTSILPVVLISVGFGSNSYTIWEDETTLFFLAFSAVILLASTFRLPGASDRRAGYIHSLIFLVSLRLASLSRLCRDEQAAFCRSTYYASASSSTSAPWQLVMSWLVALFLPAIIKSYYKQTQSYQGSVPFWIGVAFQGCLSLIAVFWTLEVADDGAWIPNVKEGLLKSLRMYIAQFVLATAAGAGGATFAYMAPCIGVEPLPPPQVEDSKKPNSSDSSRSQLVVHGTSNLYGAHYAVLPFSVLLLPLLLVSKPMGQASLALTTTAILSLLELTSLAQRNPRALRPLPPGLPALHPLRASAPPASQTDTITTILTPTLLALLAHFAFFKTGHQAVLSSLQWDAAFIALRTVRYPWSPILVVLNTAAGQILCAAAVPAAVLWRRAHRFYNATETEDGAAFGSSPSKSSPAPGEKDAAAARADDEAQRAASRSTARNLILSDGARAALVHSAVYLLLNIASTICAGHLRRHLMLYRVFSPRWMMSVVGVAVADFVLIVMGLIGLGRSVGAVAGVFGW